MTYGAETNRFLRMSTRYNEDWLAIVLCNGKAQQVYAADDAKAFMRAAFDRAGYHGAGNLMFVITPKMEDLLRFKSKEFQQVVWLFEPTHEMRTFMRSRMRCKAPIDCELLRDEVIVI